MNYTGVSRQFQKKGNGNGANTKLAFKDTEIHKLLVGKIFLFLCPFIVRLINLGMSFNYTYVRQLPFAKQSLRQRRTGVLKLVAWTGSEPLLIVMEAGRRDAKARRGTSQRTHRRRVRQAVQELIVESEANLPLRNNSSIESSLNALVVGSQPNNLISCPDVDSNLVNTINNSDERLNEHIFGDIGDEYFEEPEYNSVSESDEEVEEISLSEKLRIWATGHNITHKATSDLLKILNEKMPNEFLPSDARTLLRTPRQSIVKSICGGQYFYIGIENSLSNLVSFQPDSFPLYEQWRTLSNTLPILSISVGVDGLPISQSSNKQLWPIMGKIDSRTKIKPFLIALFEGTTKPRNIVEYLQDFVDECKRLFLNGIMISGLTYSFRISAIIADAPARAFLKSVKLFNAYHGCERCNVRGSWDGRLVLGSKPGVLRTDLSFLNQVDEDHHVGISPLSALGIGMVCQFPLDHMHLVFLGVTRKLLYNWLRGPLRVRLSGQLVNEINRRVSKIKNHLPSEFSRRPRSIMEIDHFKATEFRTFLLYTGVVLIRRIVAPHMYCHFLILSTAIHVLISNLSSNEEWNSLAENLLSRFVTDFGLIYGKHSVVYNVHSLLHLADDGRHYGSLNRVSAFPFENYMKHIKSLLRTKTSNIQQVANRCQEMNQVFPLPKSTSRKFFFKFEQCYKVNINGIVIGTEDPDRCFICKDGNIVLVSGIDRSSSNVEVIYYRKIRIKNSVSGYPVDSKSLSIFSVDINETNLGIPTVGSSANFYKKCVLLPACNFDDVNQISSKYICIPMSDSELE